MAIARLLWGGKRVSESTINPVGAIDALAHPALRAWSQLQAETVTLARVEPVKTRRNLHADVYRLTGAGPAGPAVIAKRGLRDRAQAERTAYEELLPHLPVRALRYYGFVEEAESPYCWLFLEEATGDEYSAAADAHRCLAGRWLGRVQAAFGSAAAAARLPDRGPGHYRQRLRAAHACLQEHVTRYALSTGQLALLERLGAWCEVLDRRWDQVEHICAGMPRVPIHGDFSYKNLRVRARPGGATLLVFDWETAGWGVPAVDLAQSPLPAPHFAAQPDLASYLEAVRDYWPRIDLCTIQQWANLGTLFRWAAAVSWDVRSLERGGPLKLLKRADLYQAILAHALEAAGWAERSLSA
jgi:aminoglycoside phosphotransferase (APT) family kinase protein